MRSERAAPAARILIVEDESHIAEGLRFNLEAEGYEVEIAADGPAGERALNAARAPFGAVILDLMLPGMSGFELARRIRASGNFVPILILTAKDAAQDLIRGIEDGADDSLTKPFHLDELLARVRGLLRRRRWDGVEAAADPQRSTQIGDAVVHFERFELETPRGRVELTVREMALLRALLEREGETVSRGELLQEVWGLRPDTQTRVVDSFIVRLRRYLEPNPARPKHIVSVRGRGYRFQR
ncbi:MAG TPA: response regulator transcription factor [Myxococcota bacterium]|nr:response regulator transcription factor [Myxococcota bacterium]